MISIVCKALSLLLLGVLVAITILIIPQLVMFVAWGMLSVTIVQAGIWLWEVGDE